MSEEDRLKQIEEQVQALTRIPYRPPGVTLLEDDTLVSTDVSPRFRLMNFIGASVDRDGEMADIRINKGHGGDGPYRFNYLVDANWATEVAAGLGSEGETRQTYHGHTYKVFSTIQAAIDDWEPASAAASIGVVAGTYAEQITISEANHELHIHGSGRDNTVIGGNTTGHKIGNSEVWLRDLTLTASVGEKALGQKSGTVNMRVHGFNVIFRLRAMAGDHSLSEFWDCNWEGGIDFEAGDTPDTVTIFGGEIGATGIDFTTATGSKDNWDVRGLKMSSGSVLKLRGVSNSRFDIHFETDGGSLNDQVTFTDADGDGVELNCLFAPVGDNGQVIRVETGRSIENVLVRGVFQYSTGISNNATRIIEIEGTGEAIGWHVDATFRENGSGNRLEDDITGPSIEGIFIESKFTLTPTDVEVKTSAGSSGNVVDSGVIQGGSVGITPAAGHTILADAAHTDAVGDDAVTAGSIIIGNDTPKWDELGIVVPGANIINALAVANGETTPTWKSLLDATNPADIAASASPGTSLIVARRDHVHNHPDLGDLHTGYLLDGVGRATPQSLIGGTGSADDLQLTSTSHGTKGNILLGSGIIIPGDQAALALAGTDWNPGTTTMGIGELGGALALQSLGHMVFTIDADNDAASVFAWYANGALDTGTPLATLNEAGIWQIDNIAELTGAAGVTVENVTIKDGSIELHHGTDTISSDEITAPTGGYVIAAAQTGTTDDLDGIGGGTNGRIIVVRADAGDTITVTNNNAGAGTGRKIFLNLNRNLPLVGDDEDSITLMYDESLDSGNGAWWEITHSDGAHGTLLHTYYNTWKALYTDGSGDEQELALGAAGTILAGQGAAAAPAFDAMSGDATIAAGGAVTVVAASKTAQGKVELATTAEIDTGTDTTRAMPVDQFVASDRNIRFITIRLIEAATDCAVDTTVGGDWVCPFTGTLLQSDSDKNWCSANTDTAGVTGTMVVDVHKGGTTVMTTNKLDIETGEKSTNTATTQPDLTTTAVTAGDVFTFDIDAIHTTAAKGLSVTLAIRMT